MAGLSDFIRWRDALLEARLGGIREFRDQNGETVVYKSDTEMAAAIRAADAVISSLSSGRSPNTILFKTSKGI
ncbi:hypothetical protein AX761_22215 [Rhizobium sp. 58]|nr:hypothetical protein AX761_22215 [Rhizobium sp. 58]